jgi:hypothetical protein
MGSKTLIKVFSGGIISVKVPLCLKSWLVAVDSSKTFDVAELGFGLFKTSVTVFLAPGLKLPANLSPLKLVLLQPFEGYRSMSLE